MAEIDMKDKCLVDSYLPVHQLNKLNERGDSRYDIFPISVVQAIFDKGGIRLDTIISSFNYIFVPWAGDREHTRLQVKGLMRRKSLVICYRDFNDTIIIETCITNSRIDDIWKLDESWMGFTDWMKMVIVDILGNLEQYPNIYQAFVDFLADFKQEITEEYNLAIDASKEELRNEFNLKFESFKTDIENKFNSFKSDVENKFNSFKQDIINKFNNLQSQFESLKALLNSKMDKTEFKVKALEAGSEPTVEHENNVVTYGIPKCDCNGSSGETTPGGGNSNGGSSSGGSSSGPPAHFNAKPVDPRRRDNGWTPNSSPNNGLPENFTKNESLSACAYVGDELDRIRTTTYYTEMKYGFNEYPEITDFKTNNNDITIELIYYWYSINPGLKLLNENDNGRLIYLDWGIASNKLNLKSNHSLYSNKIPAINSVYEYDNFEFIEAINGSIYIGHDYNSIYIKDITKIKSNTRYDASRVVAENGYDTITNFLIPKTEDSNFNVHLKIYTIPMPINNDDEA